MKALAWKELREVWGLAVVALMGYLALLVNLMGGRVFYWVPGLPRQPEEVAFSPDRFSFYFPTRRLLRYLDRRGCGPVAQETAFRFRGPYPYCQTGRDSVDCHQTWQLSAA
jgi:hypothetical protein